MLKFIKKLLRKEKNIETHSPPVRRFSTFIRDPTVVYTTQDRIVTTTDYANCIFTEVPIVNFIVIELPEFNRIIIYLPEITYGSCLPELMHVTTILETYKPAMIKLDVKAEKTW